MDRYFFILTTIDLFVLGFMCLLTRLSESLNKKQKRGFLLAFALIACISVLEVITIVVDGAPLGYRWLNILSNYLGFGLTPAVPLCLVYVLDKKSIIRRVFKAAACCWPSCWPQRAISTKYILRKSAYKGVFRL